MKQVKVRTWLGGFQIQLSTSMGHYVIYINMSLVGMMFWHTTGAPALRPYLPWATWWMFAILMLVIIVSLMAMDYKYMASSRYGFLNKQAYKHENLIVKDVKKMQGDIDKIKEKLGIDEDN